jgi:dipeptidyl aminopeptidase/acylaminoacyl peptidase
MTVLGAAAAALLVGDDSSARAGRPAETVAVSTAEEEGDGEAEDDREADTDDRAEPVAEPVDGEGDETPPVETDRAAPTFRSAAETTPAARGGQFAGRLLLTSDGCRNRIVVLATLARRATATRACPLATSPSGRFAAVQNGPAVSAADLARDTAGPAVAVAGGDDALPAVAVDDAGTVASCVDGRVAIRALTDGAPRWTPGCEPVVLRSGLHWLAAPDADGLPLVRHDGAPIRFRTRALRETGGPYRLAASRSGDHLAALAFHPGLGRHVLVVRVRDGHIVGRRTINPQLDADDVRVASGGRVAAVRVSTFNDPAPVWYLVRLDRRAAPVPTVGGEQLSDVTFAPDGRHMAVVTRRRSQVLILRTETFGPVARIPAEVVGPAAGAAAWLP